MMNKKYIISLIFLLSALFTSVSFADRPAEFESYTDKTPTTPIEDDSRPAAEYAPAEPVAEKIKQTGDALDIPVEATAQTVQQLDFPRRGMTEDKVQNELGRPLEIVPAVGKPPISRWVYNDRIVYFEYSSVIHVVAK